MGVEIEFDWSPVPDGQTVPHRVEVAEAAVAWDDGKRRAREAQRLGQIVYIGCCVLVPLLIIIGSAKGH